MSELRFSIDSKKLIDSLNLIMLKGKYPSGTSHRMKSLSDYVYIVGAENYLEFYNADNTSSCSYKIRATQDLTVDNISTSCEIRVMGECILDIPKTIKYLKTFSGVVHVNVEDYVTLTTENKTAKIPYVVSHPCYAMIEHVRNFELPTDGSMPSFGKENTKFEAEVTIDAKHLLDGANSCDVIGMGKYEFDYDGTSFSMSSPQEGIEGIKIDIELLTHSGEEATVALAGPFAQFLDGPTVIYLKDEFPVLFISPNRKLIKAPRITGR